jgi:hypothetical protein
MPLRFGWIICCMYPSVNPIRLWVTLQPEYFHNAIPYRLPLKRFRHRDTF